MNRWDHEVDPLSVNPPPVIDHSMGRVSAIQGQFFYSPNCSHQVTELPFRVSESYMFRETAVRLHDFFKPFWWLQPYGWLAFLPTRPSFVGDLFGHLNEFPVIERHSTGYYRLHDDVAQRWLRLENKMVWATAYIKKRYPAICLRPPPLQVFGYTRLHRTARIAHAQAHAARDWCVMWMGLLCYHIASSPTPDPSESQDGIPAWIKVLEEEGYHQSWFSGILASCVASFSSHTPRVGVFLNPFEPPAKYGLPPPRVDWLCKFHVPVWYPWNSESVAAAQRSIFLAPLTPPVHLLQEASTILTSAPSYAAPIDSASATPAQHIHVTEATAVAPSTERPWESFFALRDLRNKDIERIESAQDRQKRIQRALQPPTKNTAVCKWEWNGTFTLRERIKVSKKFNSAILDDYEGQRIYDPFTNEWDVCSEFGDEPNDEPNGERNDQYPSPDKYPNEHPDDNHPPTSQMHQDKELEAGQIHPGEELEAGQISDEEAERYLRTHPLNRTTSPPPKEFYVTDKYDATRTDPSIVLTLNRHYGFIPPLVELDAGHDDIKDCVQFRKCIGLREKSIVSRDITLVDRAMFRFVTSLAAGRRPGVDEWDLHDENRNFLTHYAPLPFSRVIANNQSHIFVLSSPSSPSCNWVLGIPRASNVLFAFREISNGVPDIYTAARSLLFNGIPFRTLRPLGRAAGVNHWPLVDFPIPIRFPNYEFTTHDYAVYLRDRESLLSQPKGRAALLRGGIVWRLALETLGMDALEGQVALEGPSSDVTNYRFGISFSSGDLESGIRYWDDELTDNELIVLCGGYRFYTGMFCYVCLKGRTSCIAGQGTQIACKSWWPLQSTWNDVSSGSNWGRWTELNKDWYQKRQAAIRAGTAQPHAASKWRSLCKGIRDARSIKNHVEAFSQQYLESR